MLATAADIRAAIPNGDTLASSVVDSLLAAADSAAKAYLQRDIESTSYTERVTANRIGEPMFVDQRPVTSIESINVAQSEAFDVWNAGAARATISVTETGLLLREFVAGVWIPTTLAFATYPTIAAIIAAVKVVAGLRWDAAQSTQILGTEPSTDLAELIGPIDISASKHKTLFLMDGVPVTDWDKSLGQFTFTQCGTKEGETVLVKYTAGYMTIPPVIVRAVGMIAAEMYAAATSTAGAGVKREKLGAYEIEKYEKAVAVLSPTVKELLSRWRRVLV